MESKNYRQLAEAIDEFRARFAHMIPEKREGCAFSLFINILTDTANAAGMCPYCRMGIFNSLVADICKDHGRGGETSILGESIH